MNPDTFNKALDACVEYRRLLDEKTNEVARLREQLTRVLLIAETFRFYTRDSEWRDMKNELDKIKAEIK